MPRDGSNIYHRPPGTDGVPNAPIESAKYNANVADVEQDLNLPRPIVAGGTGATNATDALFNLKAETATQIVTNWDSQIWVPGSFYAAASATGAAPVPGHAFAGQCYIGEPLANPPTNQNIILEARDLDSPVQPGPISARQMKAGVWSPWSTTSTAGDQASFRQSIYAAPFDALAYNGMQINGSMEVSQELGGVGTTVNGGYVCDGWMQFWSGTMAIGSQGGPIDFFPGIGGLLYPQVLTAQASMTTNDYAVVLQRIEGLRILRLAWGTPIAMPITLAFWSFHQRPGIYSGTVRNLAGTRSYAFTYTQAIAAVAQYNTITIPGCVDGAWPVNNTSSMVVTFAMASGSASTAPSAGAWLNGNYLAAPGQINAVAATSDTFRITGVVVLPGIEAPSAARSPLIMRPYDQELMTCKRYYARQIYSFRYYVPGALNGETYVIFPVAMRSTPTANIISGTYSNMAAGSPSIAPADNTGGRFIVTAFAAGDTYALNVLAELNARL